MIDILPFEPQDADRIIPKEVFESDETLLDRIKSAYNQDPMHTVFYESQVAAIIGGNLLWPGVMEVYTVTSELVKKFPKEFHKIVLALIDMYKEKLNLWRMQMDVKANYMEGYNWALRLGFEPEARLKKFGPDGSDHWLFTRLF